MPKYWLITNRKISGGAFGNDRAAQLGYFTAEANIDQVSSWTRCTAQQFRAALVAAAAAFPLVPDTSHEQQKHVTLFVHGFNNSWLDSVKRYQQITDDIYAGPQGLGICVLFSWPSDGSTVCYLPDREDARASGPALSSVFNLLYDQALLMQQKAADGTGLCRAKVSVLAHSMGNWVLQNALQYTWERKNKPLLVSLINQCVMVAADVDNDLFSSGEVVTTAPSEGMANLCYRITALYSGKDSVLGMSAGFKHFGKRRLGRSGLDEDVAEPDNVWDYDCSDLFKPNEDNIHSAYFYTDTIQNVIRTVLRGYDRTIIAKQFPAPV